MVLVNEFATLDELSVGVVTTFQPTEDELVGHYLYNKVYYNPPFSTYRTFPEIPIYGKVGMTPWEIWRSYQQWKFPHQDFIYFFSRAEKINPNKSRNSRKVGIDGSYTWSETESKKPVYVSRFQKAVGTLRKFRFENSNKDKKDKGKKIQTRASQIDDEHHGAWLMDEFTINHAPDMALCRLKSKRKSSADEEDEILRSRQSLKKLKLEPTRSYQNSSSLSEQQQAGTSSQQMPSSSYLHEIDQVGPQVVPKNDALRACIAQPIPNEQKPNQEQYSHCSVAPQQRLEPENRCQEEYHVQLPQQDQASSSHSNEQQLLADNGFDVSLDDPYAFMNGFFTDEDQPSALLGWNIDDDDDYFQSQGIF